MWNEDNAIYDDGEWITWTEINSHLERLEFLHQALILYMWLSYRMVTVFTDQDMGFHAKEMAEAKINAYLENYSDAGWKDENAQVRRVKSNVNLQDERPKERSILDTIFSEEAPYDFIQKSEGRGLSAAEPRGDSDVLVEPDAADPEMSLRSHNDGPALPVGWDQRRESPAHEGTGAGEQDYHQQEKAAGNGTSA